MAHDHKYEQDARDGRESFAVCTQCGFSTSKRHILTYLMILDRQLSPSLIIERKAAIAAKGWNR